MKKTHLVHGLIGLLLTLSGSFHASLALAENPLVRISTNLGDIDVLLYKDKAPLTVTNFLIYVDSGHYNNTIFHRVIERFMIQGGGFTPEFEKKPTRPGIRNEANNGLKNEIGTLAMARTQDPHSASAQFFINVNNNSFLDFAMAPHGPMNTLRGSQFGVQDERTRRIATTNCRGLRITRHSLDNAKSAKPGTIDSYECLMQAILGDPGYTQDSEISACLSRIEQLKRDGKLGADATCSDYVNKRHQSLKLVHVNWGYTVFGKVVQGMEVVTKIESLETGPSGPFRKDVPREAVIIQSVQRIQQEISQ